WRIELTAPQYPEGLSLTIHAKGLKGNVDIINGLNHYIGMKTLHNEDFIEFTLLPYLIVFFVISCILVAIINRKKWLNILLVMFIAFGIIAMIDFWHWEYDYGHNLNPEAAIIVPGMAYQPPLIGFKQLLNFGAYSIPATGGWIFVAVGILLVLCSVMEWRIKRKINHLPTTSIIAFLILTSIASCSTAPQPIKTGSDQCSFCKMTISDARFGAEIITLKGKVYKFDDAHCILAYLKSNELKPGTIKNIYLVDFCDEHQLLNVDRSYLLQADSLRSPMGGNIAAFSDTDSLKIVKERLNGKNVDWDQLKKSLLSDKN
ncbi:MAG: nitrous oxide reductase accessory protein NosL, partial [Ferruginibacter sp.]